MYFCPGFSLLSAVEICYFVSNMALRMYENTQSKKRQQKRKKMKTKKDKKKDIP